MLQTFDAIEVRGTGRRMVQLRGDRAKQRVIDQG